ECSPEAEFAQQNRVVQREIDYFREASFDPGIICSSAVAVRKDVFDSLGGFGSARLGEDTEFWARVALDHSVAASTRVTSIYYRGTGGVIESLKNDAAPVAPIKSLPEVSLAIKMLCEREKFESRIMDSSSIRAFINGQLLLGMRSNALNGRLLRARSFSALMVKPLERRFMLWRVFLSLPNP